MTHDESRALIANGNQHDKAMCGGKWRAFGIGSIMEVESSELHPDGCNIGVAEDMRADDARGIAWMRTNLRALLDGYAEALEEVERLRGALNYMHDKVDGYDSTKDLADEIAAGTGKP